MAFSFTSAHLARRVIAHATAPLPRAPLWTSRYSVFYPRQTVLVAFQSLQIHFFLPFKVPKRSVPLPHSHRAQRLLEESVAVGARLPGSCGAGRVAAAPGKALLCFSARLAFLPGIFFFFWRCKEILTSQESKKEAADKVTYLLGLIAAVAKGKALTAAKQGRPPSSAATSRQMKSTQSPGCWSLILSQTAVSESCRTFPSTWLNCNSLDVSVPQVPLWKS